MYQARMDDGHAEKNLTEMEQMMKHAVMTHNFF